MNLIEFHKKCMSTRKNNNKFTDTLLYGSNALAGESGEFANLVKKYYRDDLIVYGMTKERKIDMKKELFDILWYICFCCEMLNINLEDLSKCGKFEELEKRYNK